MRVSDHQQQSYKTGVAVKKFYFALGGMLGSAYPTEPKQNSTAATQLCAFGSPQYDNPKTRPAYTFSTLLLADGSL